MSNVSFNSASQSSYLLSFSFASVWIRAENVIGQLMACVMRWNDFLNSIDFISIQNRMLKWPKRVFSVHCKLATRLIDALGIGNLYVDTFSSLLHLSFFSEYINLQTNFNLFISPICKKGQFFYLFRFLVHILLPWQCRAVIVQTTGKWHLHHTVNSFFVTFDLNAARAYSLSLRAKKKSKKNGWTQKKMFTCVI